jgi:hypothetical protein
MPPFVIAALGNPNYIIICFLLTGREETNNQTKYSGENSNTYFWSFKEKQ